VVGGHEENATAADQRLAGRGPPGRPDQRVELILADLFGQQGNEVEPIHVGQVVTHQPGVGLEATGQPESGPAIAAEMKF